MRFIKLPYYALALAFVAGCDSAEDKKDTGYSDGYAVGYNTACEIRATLIEGDFNNDKYAAAYANGQTDGITACNADKASGKFDR